MNKINDAVVSKFKGQSGMIECIADNEPFNPALVKSKKFTQEKMAEFNPGSLPPHRLLLKEGCVLMLLRNWSLSKGTFLFVINVTLHSLRTSKWNKVETIGS